jgi:WD40 repeat protein
VLSLVSDFRRALGSSQVPVTALPDEATPLLVPNPYKGLHAFQEGDAADFFGRDTLVDQLLMRLVLNRSTLRQSFESQDSSPISQSPPSANTQRALRLHNFLAIIGPSGSGKSSLVKAGLIPTLRQNAIPGSRNWFIVEMTPGPDPLKALETALLRIATNPPPALLDQLREDKRGLLRAVKHILPHDEAGHDRPELLLVIDQFEEVFTLVEDEAKRSHFLDSLHAAVTEPDSRLRVVITLRADFYDRPLLYPGFGDLLRQRMETVLPLSSEELELAIAGPARRVGVTLETGLIPLIISDVQEQPGTLPLMQYALTELYKRRQGRRLALDGYQASGGVLGALARRADELYTELDDAGRAATRRLFLRLVTVGEAAGDTRRRVLRSELASLDGDGEMGRWGDQEQNTPSPLSTFGQSPISQIIDTFGQYRLLTFDRDPVTRGPTVEVAHEALIREWGRLQQWLDNDREFLMWQQRLQASLHQWESSAYDEGALLRGAPLAEAENWLNKRRPDLNEAECDFIRASLALRARRQAEREARLQRELEMEKQRAEEQTQSANRLRLRNRVITAVGGVALVLAVVAGLFGWQSNQNAVRATARELASAALANLEVDPQLSILLALESLGLSQAANTAPLAEAQDALHRAIQLSRLEFSLSGHSADITNLAFSLDGHWLASSSADGTARLWDMGTREEVAVLSGHEGAVNDLAFSPDGQLLATVGDDATLRLWDLTTFQARVIPTGHTLWVVSVAFSADGTLLVTTSRDGKVQVWDAATPEVTTILSFGCGSYDDVNDAAFSSDGLTIAAGHDDTGISRWSAISGGSEKPGFPTDRSSGGHRVWSTAISPNNKLLLAGYQSGMVRLWNMNTGEPIQTLYHTGTVFEVAFNSNGTRFVTASQDGTAKIWETRTGRELLTLYGNESGVVAATFSPDDRYLATANGAQVKVWDISPTGSQEWLDLYEHDGEVTGVAYSPDGQRLATGGTDGMMAIWNAESGEKEFGEHIPIIKIQDIAFNPDGSSLTIVPDNNAAGVWNLETGALTLRLSGHTDRVTSVAYHPDGKQLATGSFDGTVRVWDALTGEIVFELKQDGSPINDVAYDSGGHYLAAGNRKGVLMVWDVSTGQSVKEWAGHAGAISGVSFGLDGIVKVWDAGTFELFSTLTGHRGVIRDLAFSPDSASLATASSDGTTKVWPLTGGEPVTLPGHRQGVEGVAFSPDGKRLAAAGQDGSVRVYALDLGDLVTIAQSRLTRSLTTEECRQYLHLEACP